MTLAVEQLALELRCEVWDESEMDEESEVGRVEVLSSGTWGREESGTAGLGWRKAWQPHSLPTLETASIELTSKT